MTDLDALVARLRERLVKVPKPGTTPYTPHGFVEMTVGGGPYKPGDSAGLCFNQTIAYTVQEHIYAGEPLAYEAADAIEALRAEVDRRFGIQAHMLEARAERDALRADALRLDWCITNFSWRTWNEEFGYCGCPASPETIREAIDAAMAAPPVAGPTEPAI